MIQSFINGSANPEWMREMRKIEHEGDLEYLIERNKRRVRHDFAPRIAQTVNDRERLREAAEAPLSEAEHARRQHLGELVAISIFLAGMGLATIVFALCLWWAPV